MTDTQREVWWRKWCWIALRAGVPGSVGMLSGILAFARADLPYLLVPILGLALCLLAAIPLSLRAPSIVEGRAVGKKWSRWQVVLLVVALLAGLSCYLVRRFGDSPDGTRYLGVLGVVAGLATILVGNLLDWYIWDLTRRSYALLILPWFAAFELGVLGGWLAVYGRIIERVAVAHQRILGVVILAVIVEVLILLRGYITPRPGNASRQLRVPGVKGSFANLLSLRAWGGSLFPAFLLILTMTNEGVWFATLAFFVLLLGHAVGYYLLMAISPQARQRV